MRYADQKSKLLSGVYFGAPGIYLAGGALNSVFTDRKIADWDVYFNSEARFRESVEMAFEDGFWCTHASHRSVSFSDGGRSVQFMHFEFFDDAATIFDAFDFTVCMAAYDFGLGDFVLHDDFLTDCAARKLRFHGGTRFPIISALRVLKYQDRGYTIAREELLRLALACAAVDLRSWDDLEHQIGGIYGDRIKVVREGEFNAAKVISAIGTAVKIEDAQDRAHEDRDYLGSAEKVFEHIASITEASPVAPVDQAA